MPIHATHSSELPQWRKASFCNNGTCVEVAELSSGNILVRDGKNTSGPFLTFEPIEWANFVGELKNVKRGG
ncbi:DUF397 domain-containing protein [Nonomuraea sp. NPDC050556]|uniref:DUF397 domain-containing protein n=1 Tax=Nonomuraea sp. NPDC050556 TaxID=3364369 RepID=UPI0037BAF6FD